MHKNILLISIIITVVSSMITLITLITVFANRNINAVMQKETAIKIGKAILEEHFPEAFLNRDEQLEAKDMDNRWRVYNVFEQDGITEDGEKWFRVGGFFCVEIRKSTGEIISIFLGD